MITDIYAKTELNPLHERFRSMLTGIIRTREEWLGKQVDPLGNIYFRKEIV